MLECFSRFLKHTRHCRRVEVPYLDTGAAGASRRRAQMTAGTPCMVHFDGLDVTKEILYLLGSPSARRSAASRRSSSTIRALARRCGCRGCTNGPETEMPAGAPSIFFETRAGVDPDRIGIMALSLGGYHAPRAAAFEPRFKCAVAWGANYDWGETQRAAL